MAALMRRLAKGGKPDRLRAMGVRSCFAAALALLALASGNFLRVWEAVERRAAAPE
jgi:hypothetical protein